MNKEKMGAMRIGIKTVGIILAVFTFVMPNILVPIRTITSEPVTDIYVIVETGRTETSPSPRSVSDP